MTNKHLAIQIRNSLQRAGIQADPDALFDVVYNSIAENSEDTKPTLRDQFAMAALTGLLANSYADGMTQPMCTAPPEAFAQWSYTQADAMMEVRKLSAE